MRAKTCLAVVLILATAADAQIFNHPAPPGNVQALLASGVPLAGETLIVDVQGTPGLPTALFASLATANVQIPAGVVLLDLNALGGPYWNVIGPDQKARYTVSFPANLSLSGTLHLQAGIIDTNGTLSLTNRTEVVGQSVFQTNVIQPTQGQVINTASPQIVLTWSPGADPNSLAVQLDGNVVTSSFMTTATGATATLAGLANGPHTLGVTVSTPNGVVATTTRVFTVSAPDAFGVTTVSGFLLDPGDIALGLLPAPIPNALVFFDEGGPTVSTDAQGLYVITNAPNGTQLHLNFQPTATSTPPAAAYYYPAYKRPIDVFQGAMNTPDPCFLPRVYPTTTFSSLDAAGSFSCAQSKFLQDVAITNSALGVTLHIPANTFVTFPGGPPCSQNLAIAEVDRDRAPSNLPEDLRPAILITVQPTGMQFWETLPTATTPGVRKRLPIDFPNVDGLAAGTQMDLFSVDHETGQFVKMGTMAVQNGQIETIDGGLEGGSWHCTCPLALGDGRPNVPTPPPNCGIPVNPIVDPATGRYVETIPLVGRTIENAYVHESLVYDSRRMADYEILSAEIIVQAISAIPQIISASATVDGVPTGQVQWYSTAGFAESVDERRRLTYALPLLGLAPGYHAYELQISAHFGQAVRTTRVNGNFIVSAMRANEGFGQGWRLARDAKLFLSPSGDGVAIESGTGRFEEYGSALFAGGSGVRVRLFTDVSQTARNSFFATSAPVSFTVLRSGLPPAAVSEFVVPMPKFWSAPGDYLVNLGANGTLETLNPATPQGDDIVIIAPGGADAFSFLIEGWLVPRNASPLGVTVFADDTARIRLTSQTEEIVTAGTNPSPVGISVGSILPQAFSPGPLRFEVAVSDLGGNAACWVNAVGGGLPGGVINDPATYQTVPGAAPETYAALFSGVGLNGQNLFSVYAGVRGTFGRVEKTATGYTAKSPDGRERIFDSTGRLTQVVYPDGFFEAINRAASGRITSIIDRVSKVTTIPAIGESASSITDALAQTTALTHSGGQLMAVVGPGGIGFTFAYDAIGRLISRVDASGRAHGYAIDWSGAMQSYADAAGQQWQFNGTASNSAAINASLGTPATLLASETGAFVPPAGPSTEVVTVSAVRGGRPTARREYHRSGQLVGWVEDDAQTGFEVAKADASGAVTETLWDFDRGLRLRITQYGDPTQSNDDRVVEYAWHPTFAWLVGTTVNPGTTDYLSLTRALDAAGRPVQFVSSDGKTLTATYGGNGTMTQVALLSTPPQVFNFTYDTDRNLTSVTMVGGDSVAYQRDIYGNVTVVSRNGVVVETMAYSAIHNRTTISSPSGAATGVAYGPAGEVTGMTFGSSAPRTYGSTNGLPTLVQDGPFATAASYDAASRIVGFGAITLSYDANGFLNQISGSQGASTTTLTNDAGGRTTAAVLSEGGVPQSSLSLGYTAHGETAFEETTVSGIVSRLEYVYDRLGRPVTRTVKVNGAPVRTSAYAYAYGAVELQSVSETIAGAPAPLVGAITRNSIGRVVSTSWTNGRFESFTYNGAGRVIARSVTVNGVPLLTESTTYSTTGDIVGEQRTIGAAPTEIYQYVNDVDGRLVSATGPDGIESFSYDDRGNRLDLGNYDMMDEIQTTPTHAYAYTSLPNGSRGVALRTTASDLSTTAIGHDGFGQPKSVTRANASNAPIASVSVTRSPDGRIGAIGNRRFVADIAGRVLGEVRGTEIRHYVSIQDSAPDFWQIGTSHVVAASDIRGAVVAAAGAGAPIRSRRFSAYGATLFANDLPFWSDFGFGFGGMIQIEGTDLLITRARIYEPLTGRFLSAEGLIEFASIDSGPRIGRFNAMRSAPIHFVDFTGFSPAPVFVAAVAAVVEVLWDTVSASMPLLFDLRDALECANSSPRNDRLDRIGNDVTGWGQIHHGGLLVGGAAVGAAALAAGALSAPAVAVGLIVVAAVVGATLVVDGASRVDNDRGILKEKLQPRLCDKPEERNPKPTTAPEEFLRYAPWSW